VCLKAAAALNGGALENCAEGSTCVSFLPPATDAALKAEYIFDIGSAGSTTLVFATIFPILVARMPPQHPPVKVRIVGGTHASFAPCADFLRETLVPALLRLLNVRVEVTCARHGFNPAGGGVLECVVYAQQQPLGLKTPLPIFDSGVITGEECTLLVTPSFPPPTVATLMAACKRAMGDAAAINVLPVPASGSAAAVQVRVFREGCAHVEVVTVYPEARGKLENTLTEELRRSARSSLAAISAHTADQLLLPLAVCGGGSFLCAPFRGDAHFPTNAGVIQAFLDVVISFDGGGVGGVRPGGSVPFVSVEEQKRGEGVPLSLHCGVLVTVPPLADFKVAPVVCAEEGVVECLKRRRSEVEEK